MYGSFNDCDHAFWVNVFSIGVLIKINEYKTTVCLFWQMLIYYTIHLNTGNAFPNNRQLTTDHNQMLYVCVFQHTCIMYLDLRWCKRTVSFYVACNTVKQRKCSRSSFVPELDLLPHNDCSWRIKTCVMSSNTSTSHCHIKEQNSGGNCISHAVHASAPTQQSKEILLYACAASLWALWWHISLSRSWGSHQTYCMAVK